MNTDVSYNHAAGARKKIRTKNATRASLVARMVKNLPAMQDPGSIPGLGRSPGEVNGKNVTVRLLFTLSAVNKGC